MPVLQDILTVAIPPEFLPSLVSVRFSILNPEHFSLAGQEEPCAALALAI